MSSVPRRVAFVCGRNAGRSQLATSFAEQERREREVGRAVEILAGGTQPAGHVHDVVLEAMNEGGFDLTERTPRAGTFDEREEPNILVTAGCSAAGVCPAARSGESRDRALDDPGGRNLDEAWEIRDEVSQRVRERFDEIEREVARHV